MLEAALKPTQQRVLAMTGALGDLNVRFVHQEQKVRQWGLDMQDHLGLGNGTLK